MISVANILTVNFTNKAIAVMLSLFFVACGEQHSRSFTISGKTMGTKYHIMLLAREDGQDDPKQLKQAIDQQLRLINQQMSTWQDDSELSRLNAVPAGQWTAVSANLFDVLMTSTELSWLSNGAFDITVEPLVKLWGFGKGGKPLTELPEPQQINERLEQVGFDLIGFDLENNSVQKQRPVIINLSSIAKGFAVDKVAELLEFAGYEDFMVEIGGELRLKGSSPRGTPWRIAIEEPRAHGFGEINRAVVLSDAAIATSGDYRNYFEKDGKRYSHTIDPKTGYPISHKLASVTVIADSATYADGLATAINVMGPEAGLKLAKEQNFAVYMLLKTDAGFEAVYTEAFQAYLP